MSEAKSKVDSIKEELKAREKAKIIREFMADKQKSEIDIYRGGCWHGAVYKELFVTILQEKMDIEQLGGKEGLTILRSISLCENTEEAGVEFHFDGYKKTADVAQREAVWKTLYEMFGGTAYA